MRFSIIVPCYNVQAYLRDCLDSILGQPFADFELLAVDDASPDHSGEILDEYADRDPRVRVIHLEQNVGLGPARNVAIEQAKGDYLLFVDSDDLLAPGALAAIAHRLEETDPDILFFDHARLYWDGSTKRNRKSYLLREAGPEVFTLAERASVFELFGVAWNKAYRRSFFEREGLRYPPGYYEDIPVSYPAVMLAERISFLPEVCYLYRQRRSGSILATSSTRHFEVLEQYDRVLAFMAANPERTAAFRDTMFERLIVHETTVLRQNERLPAGERKRFFDAIAEQYHRWRPEGFVPTGRDAWKVRMVERRAFRGFVLAMRRREVATSFKDAREQVAPLARDARRRAIKRARTTGYRLQRTLPLRPDTAVFAVNRYRVPAGNPLAVYRALREHAPHVQAVWAVRYADRARVPAGIDAVIDGSSAYFRALARSTYFVNNANFGDMVVKRRGQIHVMTQHGTPLRTMGLDLKHYPAEGRDLDVDQMLRRADRWDYNVAASRFAAEVWERVYPCSYRMIEAGNPRNDVFFRSTADDVRAIRERLGIPPGKVAVWYTPLGERSYEVGDRRGDELAIARRLREDQVLVLRRNPSGEPDIAALTAAGSLVTVPLLTPTEDVCLAADVLITDYSSIMFDYANLGRPIVIYADDYETYRRVRGTYFDLLAEPPGAVATTQDELIEVLTSRSYDGPEAAERLEAFRRRFCEWDDGHAAERVVRAVFLGEQPPPPLPFEQRMPAPAPRAAG